MNKIVKLSAAAFTIAIVSLSLVSRTTDGDTVTVFANAKTPSAAQQTTSEGTAVKEKKEETSKEMRGIWVASVVNIDYPSKPTADPEILREEALKIIENVEKAGLNAIFLQVRPTADSFYKSEYFPWSKFLTGTQGKAPDNGFDPLEFWIEEAHKRGIELHAWINPYRITKKTASEPKPEISSLYYTHPARKHPDWVVRYSDNNLYFNPGIPEVRQLIVDSVLEIINNYEVDGIHFDDYFYPGRDFNDSKTYAKYGKGYSNIGDWRRANVNALVSDVYKAIKNTGKNVRFGISPFGIWANKSNNSLGSDTKGLETYYDHYADSRKWVKDKIVDYIAPQLYWNIGYSVADYSKLLAWWENVVSGTSVDLYIGHAAYRVGNSSSSSPWYGISEIDRQLQLNQKSPEVDGSIFYNYTAFASNPGLGAMIKAIYEKKDGAVIGKQVTVSRPSGNTSTSYAKYYLNGSSDPDKPLYLNGEEVKNRSKSGYFGILVDLKNGSNIFTLSQEGTFITRVINKTSGTAAPAKMKNAEITASSAFPQSQEYRMPGEKITLSCEAPAGSKVTVKIDGKTYTMKATSSYESGSMYPVKYTYTYTIPSYSGTARIIDLGAPVYTMTYKGVSKSLKAPAKIGVVMKGAPFYAEVAKDDIDTFETPNSANGAAFELRKGMVDYVTGMTGSYVRLASGLWVRKTSVTTYTSKTALSTSVKTAVYKAGEKWDTLKLDYAHSLAATASYDGTSIEVNISKATSGVIPELPANSMLSSVSFKINGHHGQYILTLKKGQVLEGYYIEKTNTGIILHLKRPVRVENTKNPKKPLSGITIMLDPGHGGDDSGAIGPLGLQYPEKKINLETAQRLKRELELLGAKVLMTRTTDVAVSLEDRLAASRKALPDMFLSIHANSMADNVDISKINGFSAHYKEALAKPLAQVLANQSAEAGRRNRGIVYNNFYVVRGTWTPSILIETGFVPNPDEFELLTSISGQKQLAKSLAEGIAEYFSK